MVTLDLRVGQCTRLGGVLCLLYNHRRYKTLKDLAPLFVYDEETDWFYPVAEIKWNGVETIQTWLDLFLESFPEVKEEVDLLKEALLGKTTGRVVAYEVFQQTNNEHLNKTWCSSSKSFTIKHPGPSHPYSVQHSHLEIKR